MNSSLKITAIIPTYNRADYLHESITAVLRQNRAPDQIIVVDDGSTDQTSTLLSMFGGDIEVLRKENGGKSSALNLALKHVRGDAIWIMDDDDIAITGGLETLEAELASRDDVGFVFGHYDNFTISGSARTHTPGRLREFDLDNLFFSGLLDFFAFQPAMLIRKSCFDIVGSFDEGLARSQDYDMLLRLAAEFRASHIAKVIFHQRQHVGARGPAHDRIDGSRVWDLQGQYDRRCVTKAIRQQPLAAFTPWSKKQISASPAEQVRALFLRSVISMLKLNDSNGAADDIVAAAAIARRHIGEDGAALVPVEIWDWICSLAIHDASHFSSLVSAAGTAPRPMRQALLRPLLTARLKRIAGMIRRKEIRSASEIMVALRETGAIALRARMLI